MRLTAEVLYRSALAAGLTIAATLGMSVATAAPVAAATTHHVTMTGFPANPSFCVEGDCNSHTVTISPGDTVTWTYSDGLCDASLVCPGHNATSISGPEGFSSPTLSGGGGPSYSRAFGTSGAYTYNCSIHGSGRPLSVTHMDGTIVVRAAASQGVLSAGPTVTTIPGSGSGSGSGGFPTGTSNSVSSDQLPNTFIPGLPVAGRAPVMPPWMIVAAGVLLMGLPALVLTSLGLAARRR